MSLVAATPRDLLDPGKPPVPMKTMDRWTQFLGSIASGTLMQDAMLKHFMTRADIEACVRLGSEERQRWDEARMAAQKRNWSAFDLDDTLARIAGGEPVMKAVAAVKGSESAYTGFMQLVVNDPEFNERYLRALKSRAILEGETILGIADGQGNDYLDNGKGGYVPDNAKVNRDKLRVETRKGLMQNWYPKLFGEQKQAVQVAVQVNYAERLESARHRAKTKVIVPKITQEVIEAVFREEIEADDLAFLDEAAAQ